MARKRKTRPQEKPSSSGTNQSDEQKPIELLFMARPENNSAEARRKLASELARQIMSQIKKD